MHSLVARDAGGQVVGAVALSERPVTIGRAPECSIVLPTAAISRKHASVYLQDGDVVIHDEGSANGVQVDGRYITGPTVIDQDSLVEISDFTLALEPLHRQLESAGTAAPAGPQVDVSHTMLEPQMRAPQRGSLQLVGRGGPYDGTVFILNKPLLTIGRVDDNEIVLEDPSISRRHAQIRLSAQGDGFTVLDLRSSNGTFVDGQRTKRAECTVDSIVRFGDLAFKVVQRRETQRVDKQRTTRQKLIIAGAVVVAILLTVAIVAKIRHPSEPAPKQLTAEDRLHQLQVEIQTLVEEGDRRMELREWQAAIEAFDKALAKDPLNKDAKRRRDTARQEISNKVLYDKGMELFGLGSQENLERAKAAFAKLPSSSVYHRDVRYRIRTINERLADGYRIDGMSQCKARYWAQCQEALCKFFELIPPETPVPGESRLRRKLKKVEERLARKSDFVPCKAKRYLNTPASEQQGANPDEILAARYPLEALRAVLKLYLEGRIVKALKQLAGLRQRRSLRPHWADLQEVNRQLVIIRGKYQEGYSAFRDQNAEQCNKHWSMVLSADRAIIPEGIESFYRREVKRGLGDLYFQLGDEEFKVGHFREAFTHWTKGKQVNPAHERLLNGLLELEKVAERLIREASALGGATSSAEARQKLQTARDITEKGRPIRQEAVKALGGS